MKRSIENVVKSFTEVSTPTLSKDELNLRLSLRENALPF